MLKMNFGLWYGMFEW